MEKVATLYVRVIDQIAVNTALTPAATSTIVIPDTRDTALTYTLRDS